MLRKCQLCTICIFGKHTGETLEQSLLCKAVGDIIRTLLLKIGYKLWVERSWTIYSNYLYSKLEECFSNFAFVWQEKFRNNAQNRHNNNVREIDIPPAMHHFLKRVSKYIQHASLGIGTVEKVFFYFFLISGTEIFEVFLPTVSKHKFNLFFILVRTSLSDKRVGFSLVINYCAW